MDDVFACSKKYEVYGREDIVFWKVGVPISCLSNFLFMKYVWGFRKRLPYREINAEEWKSIFEIFNRYNAKITIGITATWVEKDSNLTPFFEKFPKEANVLREGMKEGLVEIANHGYTHCVVGKHLPRPFSSNRILHREFWDWVPVEVHKKHMELSQRLISQYFGKQCETFIPPGHVWTKDTERFAFENGIRYLSAREALCPTGTQSNGLTYIGEKKQITFHDRDLVLNGINWLADLMKRNSDKKMVTVAELGRMIRGRIVNDE
jgi:peptidoglycan/xylan/chitin deacetylase (PgdA/CDA1 family)